MYLPIWLRVSTCWEKKMIEQCTDVLSCMRGSAIFFLCFHWNSFVRRICPWNKHEWWGREGWEKIERLSNRFGKQKKTMREPTMSIYIYVINLKHWRETEMRTKEIDKIRQCALLFSLIHWNLIARMCFGTINIFIYCLIKHPKKLIRKSQYFNFSFICCLLFADRRLTHKYT